VIPRGVAALEGNVGRTELPPDCHPIATQLPPDALALGRTSRDGNGRWTG
jgi:hypothetical protein